MALPQLVSLATDVFWIGLIAVVALALFHLIQILLQFRRIDYYLAAIPSPKGSLPLLGHALKLMGAEPWLKMRKWAAEAGTMVTFNVTGTRVVYVNDPKLLKRVLQTKQKIYRKDLEFSYKHFLCLLGQGLVTSEDEKWRKGRMFLSHALRYDLVKEVPAVALPGVHRLISLIHDARALEEPIDMCEAFRHLFLQVIGELVLSLDHADCDAIFPKLYLPVVTESNKRVWSPWRQFMPWLKGWQDRRRGLNDLNKELSALIKRRWALRQKEAQNPTATSSRRQDMLDYYMSQIPDLDKTAELQLRDEIKTMLLAGHETSAATLTWSLFEVLSNPELARVLRREHEQIFGHLKVNEPPSLEDIKRLRWTPSVIREAMRKYSVVPLVMRVASEDDVIPAAESGYDTDLVIPKGARIMVGIDGVHHRPDLWPNPDEFIPERFLDYVPDIASATAGTNANGEVIDPYAYIPFIQGPRNCLGQHVSFTEMQIILSYLCSELVDGKTGNLTHSFVLHPSKAGQRHEYEIPVCPKHGLLIQATK